MALVPVRITDDGFVQPVDYHGSAHITALSGADGIITVPVGVKKLEKGTILNFQANLKRALKTGKWIFLKNMRF